MNLYIVATPIGNLKDITFRAVEILKSVDFIICEDTRVTKKLLDAYEIMKPTVSYHKASRLEKIDYIIEMIKEGKSTALVSDAGTPTISDPGSFLVKKAREVLGDELTVVPVPGPSALVSAISVSGFGDSAFIFYGFLPHKKGRETIFKEIAESEKISVFYESPHRFIKTLFSLKEFLGPKKKICVARELTKIFEETKIGEVEDILKYYENNPDKVKGEFVIVVSGPTSK